MIFLFIVLSIPVPVHYSIDNVCVNVYVIFNVVKRNFSAPDLFSGKHDGWDMKLHLGCIADDFTGASDLALMLAEHGMPVTQILGMPAEGLQVETAAVVIALKTRTIPAGDAVAQSERAAKWLLERRANQLLFKYCSTFDSTPSGNIGPVTNALLRLLDDDFTVVCPAFPNNGRTVVNSRLMVNGIPLSESSMRHHPLTPMRNANLLELMDEQTWDGASAYVSLDIVRAGPAALESAFAELRRAGHLCAIPDIETNDDLMILGQASKNLKLVTGASGVAMGLPYNTLRNYGNKKDACAPLPALPGQPVIIAGSCSQATRGQVEFMKSHCQSIEIDPCQLADGLQTIESLCEKAESLWKSAPVLVSSVAHPDKVREAQQQLGIEGAAALVEQTLASIAVHLATKGACKFILAGGETSGAVAAALGAGVLRTGPRIDSGVPWMIRADGPVQVLSFKSGNFGSTDFFLRAMKMLP
jgi:uncharacterized protein YgbK (DUF1537 family)